MILVGLKMVIIKMMVLKICNDRWDAVIGWTCFVSHHLRSVLDAIELTVMSQPSLAPLY
jgi:hypothetical protein